MPIYATKTNLEKENPFINKKRIKFPREVQELLKKLFGYILAQ